MGGVVGGGCFAVNYINSGLKCNSSCRRLAVNRYRAIEQYRQKWYSKKKERKKETKKKKKKKKERKKEAKKVREIETKKWKEG